MLLRAALLALIGFALLFGEPAPSSPAPKPVKTYGLLFVERADRNVRRTHACEKRLGLKPTPTTREYAKRHSPGYRYRAFRTWLGRAAGCLRIERDPIAAILFVFRGDGPDAVDVADCETGGTFDTDAENGQYLGLFQMGESERETYGHGSTAYAQARAAKRYFDASGQDWSPWDPVCRP